MNEYQKDEKIKELNLELIEKTMLLDSELKMNKDLKIQIELARERVFFKEYLDKI